MAAKPIDLEQELDQLYALPAGEFVARRNELAKRLSKAGDRDAAGRVKKLPRPSITAWAVNQLASRAGAELEGLRAAGERVRAAHLAGPKEQRAAARSRRDVISTLRLIAEVALQEAGTSPTRGHRRRISRTLEVLSSQGPEAGRIRAGRLSVDLEPAGFDALTDLSAALAAARKQRPRPVEKVEPAVPGPKPGAEPGKPLFSPPSAPARASNVVEHPASKVRANQEARRAEEAEKRRAEERRAEERQRLHRRQQRAREELEQIEERSAGLRLDTERATSQLDLAKRAEAALAEAARQAERLANEARARAESATEVTCQARREAESAAAALNQARAERERARQQLQDIDTEFHMFED